MNVDNIWKEVQFSKTLFICIIRFNKKYNASRNIKHNLKTNFDKFVFSYRKGRNYLRGLNV